VHQRLVDQLDVTVGELLHLVGLLPVLVFRDLAVLLGLLEPQVPYRLSPLPTYINVCEVLF
jgi:hypothetical protein